MSNLDEASAAYDQNARHVLGEVSDALLDANPDFDLSSFNHLLLECEWGLAADQITAALLETGLNLDSESRTKLLRLYESFLRNEGNGYRDLAQLKLGLGV